MLAQVVRSTSTKDIQNLRTKASSGVNNFKAQVKNRARVVSEAKSGISIVDNPNQVAVEFPVKPRVVLNAKYPFFKSVTMKLAQLNMG